MCDKKESWPLLSGMKRWAENGKFARHREQMMLISLPFWSFLGFSACLLAAKVIYGLVWPNPM